ncbi:MAG: alpha/beta fold hydrolase [Candidatus Limnocylindria bacterium]
MNTMSVQARVIDDRRARAQSSKIVIALAACALLLLSMLPATALAKPVLAGDRPTIVLVHGAWASPSGWDQVVAGLQKDGYATATPELEEATLSGDVATVRATLDAIPGDKILVAHSYGGMVISNAGAGRSDVRALVYTAGLVPDEGETAFTVQDGYRQSEALNHLIFDPFPFAFIDPAFFPQFFCQDLSPKKAAELNAGQRATGLGALTEPSGPVAWKTLPSWYAISGQDLIIDPAAQEFMSARAGATVVRFDDASHAGAYTHYVSRFVKLIEEAVAATAG